jgi:plasmid stabilization system protein ParE
MKLVIRPAAAGDLENAFLWYEQQRIGLGDAFLAAAGSVFEKILSHPEMYPVIHRQTRRALLRRFPYCVYFRAYPEVVVIVACMHGRRDPAEWRVRA